MRLGVFWSGNNPLPHCKCEQRGSSDLGNINNNDPLPHSRCKWGVLLFWATTTTTTTTTTFLAANVSREFLFHSTWSPLPPPSLQMQGGDSCFVLHDYGHYSPSQAGPIQTHGNTTPIPIQVWCSQVQVRVEQDLPRVNPCHALVSRSSLVQFLTPKRGNCGLQLVQTIAHNWRATTKLNKIGLIWFKPQKTSFDQSYHFFSSLTKFYYYILNKINPCKSCSQWWGVARKIKTWKHDRTRHVVDLTQ